MTPALFEEPADTREEILGATYRALREHGYADLTIQRIGDEFAKSQSLIYHHYEDKDDLVLACLEFMLEWFQDEHVGGDVADPRSALESTLDVALAVDIDETQTGFRRTLVDLRSQVSHDQAFSEHFARSDRLMEEHIEDIVAAGIEQGQFRDVEPDRIATTIYTTITGVFYRDATTDDDRAWVATVRDELQDYLDSRVYE